MYPWRGYAHHNCKGLATFAEPVTSSAQPVHPLCIQQDVATSWIISAIIVDFDCPSIANPDILCSSRLTKWVCCSSVAVNVISLRPMPFSTLHTRKKGEGIAPSPFPV
jgi:hypothetical protein